MIWAWTAGVIIGGVMISVSAPLLACIIIGAISGAIISIIEEKLK